MLPTLQFHPFIIPFRFVQFQFFRSVYFSFSFLLFDAPISERRRRVRHGWLITGAYSFNSMTHQKWNLFFNFLGLRRENTMKVKWTRDPWTKPGRSWTRTKNLTNLGPGKSETGNSDLSVHGYLNVKKENPLENISDIWCRLSEFMWDSKMRKSELYRWWDYLLGINIHFCCIILPDR